MGLRVLTSDTHPNPGWLSAASFTSPGTVMSMGASGPVCESQMWMLLGRGGAAVSLSTCPGTRCLLLSLGPLCPPPLEPFTQLAFLTTSLGFLNPVQSILPGPPPEPGPQG